MRGQRATHRGGLDALGEDDDVLGVEAQLFGEVATDVRLCGRAGDDVGSGFECHFGGISGWKRVYCLATVVRIARYLSATVGPCAALRSCCRKRKGGIHRGPGPTDTRIVS